MGYNVRVEKQSSASKTSLVARVGIRETARVLEADLDRRTTDASRNCFCGVTSPKTRCKVRYSAVSIGPSVSSSLKVAACFETEFLRLEATPGYKYKVNII